MSSTSPTVAILGREHDTVRYEKALSSIQVSPITTLDPELAIGCDMLLLPGGGDITPAFFGQTNIGSQSIDTPLDILQLQALDYFVKEKKPVLGICKGIQLINVHFGGTLTQHIETAESHRYVGHDQQHYVYHSGLCRDDFFYQLYGTGTLVNSAHHQAIDKPGHSLLVTCRAKDQVIEGIMHCSLPIIGVQWHPERFMEQGGELLLRFFVSAF